jgi:hypothetical protein
MGGAASRVSSARESLERVHKTLTTTIRDLQRVDDQAVASLRSIVASPQGDSLDSKLRQIDDEMRLRSGNAEKAIRRLGITREEATRMSYRDLLDEVKNVTRRYGGGGKSRRRKGRKARKLSRRRT